MMCHWLTHYSDVRMGAIASQITSLTIVYSIVYLSADQRKHQCSALLAFLRGIHRRILAHMASNAEKMFPFDDVIMCYSQYYDGWLSNSGSLCKFNTSPKSFTRKWNRNLVKPTFIFNHDDVIKWKHFPRNWPFVRGIHRSRWIPHTKASDAELWCFLWFASE